MDPAEKHEGSAVERETLPVLSETADRENIISNGSVGGGGNGEQAIASEDVHVVGSSPQERCESVAEEGNNATPSTTNLRTDVEVDDQKGLRTSNLAFSSSNGSLSRSAMSGLSGPATVDPPSRFDGELALSVLHSHNDDQMLRVGAIHSTEKDSAEIQKKLGGGRHDDAAERRRSSRASQTSFDERLRRKLEENSSKTGGDNSLDNDRKQNDLPSKVSVDQSPQRSGKPPPRETREAAPHGVGSTNGHALPSMMTEEETTNPGDTAFESDSNVGVNTDGHERRSASDSTSKNPVPKRMSSLSLGNRRSSNISEEDYWEFLNRKITNRNVGVTYSERSRTGGENREEDSVVPIPPRTTANTLEGPPVADLDSQPNSRQNSVHSSYVRSSDRQMSVRSLSSFYKPNGIRGLRSDTTGIPDEEEKVGDSKLENDEIIDAEVRASDEDISRMPSEQTHPATEPSELACRRTHGMGNEARHYFTPGEIAKIDLEQQQEDSIVVGDVSPEVIVNDAPSRRTRRSSWTNTLSRSMSALTNNSGEGRHTTDPFGVSELSLQMNEPSQQQLRNLADLVEAQDVVQARLVTDDDERDNVETVEAIPVNEKELTRIEKFRRHLFLVWVPLLVIAGVILASIFATSNRGGEVNGTEPLRSAEKKYDPTLVQVRKEGVLRCGVPNKYGFAAKSLSNEMEGLSVDLCKAVAAAVLGSNFKIDLVEVTSTTRFTALAGRKIDLLLWGDTHTMERGEPWRHVSVRCADADIYFDKDFSEKSTGVGFQFSDPYVYDGLGFAGFPAAVACADNFNWIGSCSSLKICVNAGTTHSDVLRDIFPAKYLVLCDTKDTFLQTFVDGGCSVIAGEQNDVAEIVVRNYGYADEFGYGNEVLSKEPLGTLPD